MRKFIPLLLILASACAKNNQVQVKGDLMQWHRVELIIPGPEASETSMPNPFLDYRLDVEFSKGNLKMNIPGFFAADGNASESSAVEGNLWKVYFNPPDTGTWNYSIRFLTGRNIAVSDSFGQGSPLEINGITGSFKVASSDKTGADFRAKGRLVNAGNHYMKHVGSGDYFLKGGADSPENFLGYIDFDGTYYGGNKQWRSGESAPNLGLHRYEPHIGDWKEGDPVWQEGKGKGIIGAVNYLASKGMNSIYFLTMNILGDGEDVWPYTDRNERYRFDVSKLDQWEIVFSHMESLGIKMHVVLQETENECLLDAGYLDVQRKLYLREMIARFAHHNGLIWNLGEEHGPDFWTPYGQTVEDTKKMASFIKQTDPYNNVVVVHTHAADPAHTKLIQPYLGFEDLDGISVQLHQTKQVYEKTLYWRTISADSGKNWIICQDELGPAWKGVLPDETDPVHDTIRKEALWANLMAGGGGVEWYFGYRFPHSDLSCEDFRSRENMWDQTRYALEFFHKYVPFWNMKPSTELTDRGWCMYSEGEIYLVYLPEGGEVLLDLRKEKGLFTVAWFNPRTGGELYADPASLLKGGSRVSTGKPPMEENSDWVCLIRAAGN